MSRVILHVAKSHAYPPSLCHYAREVRFDEPLTAVTQGRSLRQLPFFSLCGGHLAAAMRCVRWASPPSVIGHRGHRSSWSSVTFQCPVLGFLHQPRQPYQPASQPSQQVSDKCLQVASLACLVPCASVAKCNCSPLPARTFPSCCAAPCWRRLDLQQSRHSSRRPALLQNGLAGGDGGGGAKMH